MTPRTGRFLRENAFLVAAVLLPCLVVLFFLLSSTIPRWIVPPPAYDLLLRGSAYDQAGPRVAVEIGVRDGRVEATVRPAAPNTYPSRPTLWLFDHQTLSARQIPIELPETIADADAPKTIVVAALAGRRVLDQTRAPDGYEVRTRAGGSPGLIGDLFGMRRYDLGLSIVNRGRVIPITLATTYEYPGSAMVLGWLAGEGAR